MLARNPGLAEPLFSFTCCDKESLRLLMSQYHLLPKPKTRETCMQSCSGSCTGAYTFSDGDDEKLKCVLQVPECTGKTYCFDTKPPQLIQLYGQCMQGNKTDPDPWCSATKTNCKSCSGTWFTTPAPTSPKPSPATAY